MEQLEIFVNVPPEDYQELECEIERLQAIINEQQLIINMLREHLAESEVEADACNA